MKYVPNKVSKLVATTALKASKHSPQVLFGAGVAGVVATVVLASRATLRIDDILEEAREISEQIELADSDESIVYTPEEQVKDKALLRIRTAVQIGKLYLPAVVVGGLSIAALTGSHRILTKRNAGLTAAYAALDRGFREYRERVIEDLGEEKDRHYRYGVEKQKVVHVDDAGKKTVVEKNVATSGPSGYARLFEEMNPNWTPNLEYNLIFLRGIQNQATQQLESKGFLILNDVYRFLGLDYTSAGSQVGWIYEGNGDSFVDFGLFDDAGALHDYLVGRTDGAIWVDFNVAGVVYDKIDKIGR